MKILLKYVEQIKLKFRDYFIAEGNEPSLVRKKHLRLGSLVGALFLVACYFIQNSGNSLKNLKVMEVTKHNDKNQLKTIEGIKELANGPSNELLWTEIQGQELEGLKAKQQENETSQKSFNEKLSSEKVSKEDMENSIAELEAKIEQKYKDSLLQEINKLKGEILEFKTTKQHEAKIESKSFKNKKHKLKLGEYIPANSYAQGKLIFKI